ncbi:MAG: pantetheine-phosphate adenylyltransferase [Muribaculaceae bacterium]
MKKISQSERRVAMFPGSFDPFTVGHESIVERALPLFDEIVIAIGVNYNKQTLTTAEERIAWIRGIFRDEPKVRVIHYTGLTVDAAHDCGATYILRGVRMIQDFEYEKNIAETNRAMSGIETVLLYTLPEYGHISSSIVRELVKYNHDVSEYLPKHCDPSLIPATWKVKY